MSLNMCAVRARLAPRRSVGIAPWHNAYLCLLVILASCVARPDDASPNRQSVDREVIVVSTQDLLPDCTSSNEGKIYYDASTKQYYYCSDGALTELAGLGSPLNVKDFGAKGDDNTDDTAAIQAAVDEALRTTVATVYMPDGRYRTTGPIHLGYGHTFRSVNLVGADVNSYGEWGFPGVVIRADFSNAPAIVVQGGRNVKIKNIALRGTSYRHGLFTWGPLINSQTVPYADVSDPQKWVTNISASGMSRYAPYAGIAIDPYSGVRPAVSYPDVAYPAWTSITTQYEKAPSSATTIENVLIDGFFVGVVNQPSDFDGNGDFTTIRDSQFSNVAYGVSVGNTQSRNVSISNSQFQYVHTILSTDVFGRRNGRIGGPVTNCSAGQIYQMFSLSGPISAAVVWQSFYVEEFIRMGIADTGGTSSNPIILDGCTLNYAGFITGGVSGAIYNVPLYEGDAPLSLNATDILFSSDFGLVTGKWGPPVQYTNSAVQAWGYNTPFPEDYKRLAYNYLVGGAATLSEERKLIGSMDVIPMQVAAPNPPALGSGGRFTSTAHGRGQIHRYITQVQYGALESGPLVPIQGINREVPLDLDPGGALQNEAFDEATMKLIFTYPNSFQSNNNTRIEAGCILWHQHSNSIFVVDTVAPAGSDWDVSATMVTNYRIDQFGKRVPITPVSMTQYAYLFQTFHKSTNDQYRGDTLAGSPVVSNVARPDGYGGTVQNDFKVGDLVYNSSRAWDNYLPANAKVVSVGEGPGPTTLTVSQNATVTATGVPIELFR